MKPGPGGLLAGGGPRPFAEVEDLAVQGEQGVVTSVGPGSGRARDWQRWGRMSPMSSTQMGPGARPD